MKTAIKLEDIAAAEQPLLALEATLETELKLLESRPRTPADYLRPAQLREALRQLREGASLGEGMDARLWAVLSTEQMRRFRFRAPGLAPLRRLRDRLLAEQQAAAEPQPVAPVLNFRYTGPPWKFKVAGARRNTGDVVQLSEEVAVHWADKLEPV